MRFLFLPPLSLPPYFRLLHAQASVRCSGDWMFQSVYNYLFEVSHSVSFVIIQVLEVNGRILQMDAIQSRLAACFITNEGVMSLRDAHPKTKRKENETFNDNT